MIQAAKKAGMAAQYHVDVSQKEPTVDVKRRVGCHQQLQKMRRLLGSEDSMQYPGSHGIPHEYYTKDHAVEAHTLANEIVRLCTEFIAQ